MRSVASHRQLVESLERSAARSPGWYRIKVAALAIAGYAFLAVALLLALALSLGLGIVLLLTKSVWAVKLIKLVWIPLVIGWVILRALWVPIGEPEGRRLRPGEAPELERQIESLRRQAGAPALSGILIDSDLNAAAASVPRLLGLAGNRHFLLLGLPLLRVMSPEEMSAVIAHEFGHFGHGHGRFSGWIYRVRQSWFRLLDALQRQQSAASGIFLRFFDWYAPYFNAYSFVLARSNEFEADAVASRLVGPEVAGRALVRVSLASRQLHGEFWPRIDRLTLVQAEPPAALYGEMARSLGDGSPDDHERLAQALAATPDLADTHPVLAQRLAALQVTAVPPPRPAVSAADAWLGPLADQLQAEFDQEWRAWVEERWTRRHHDHAAARARYAELAEKQADAGLEGEELLQWADLSEQMKHDEDALPLYEAALVALPERADIVFSVGARRLARDDARGVALIEQAIVLEPDFEAQALQCLADFHYRHRHDAAFDAIQGRIRAWNGRQQKQDAERSRLGGKDRYEPHGLPPEALDALEAALLEHGKVSKAWLVRKHISDGATPHFVLVVALRGMVLDAQGQLERLLPMIELPGSIFAVDKSTGGQVRKVIKAAGEPVFRR